MTYEADPFAAGPLDASLWGDLEASNPYEAHPFGTLAVDALFALPGSLPGSPLKGDAAAGSPSPFDSPLRAPGSPAPATPTLPTPAAADGSATPSPAPAPPVPTVTSIPLVAIETGHASTGAADVVVVVAPRAAKRLLEEPADAGRSPRRRRRSDGAESDDSDASALSLERDDILPVLLAAPLDSQAQVWISSFYTVLHLFLTAAAALLILLLCCSRHCIHPSAQHLFSYHVRMAD